MPSADIHRQNLLTVFRAALERVNGRSCVREYLSAHPHNDPVYLIAIGKAATAMTRGAQDVLDAKIRDALVITKHGYGEVLPWPCLTAGHPVPDAASLAAGDKLQQFVSGIPDAMAVLVLLSGGASALVEQLPRGVTLEQLQAVNDWMLGAGLDIEVCNAVRKRVSLLKGGRLALRLAPRPVLCLMLSDVPDNNPATIGSGPLVPDARLREAPPFVDQAPAFVRDLLELAPPAPAPGEPAFARVQIAIVATLDDAKHAAHEVAHTLGYRAIVEPQFIDGDALRVGTRLAQVVVDAEPGSLHVWGGETQVMLPPHPGRGGRSQSLALAAAQVLRDHPNVLFLGAGTDGSDGPTEDAGALVDGGTLARGTARGLDPGTALACADAGSFLQASGDLIKTGPTGTNVMDMMLGLKF